MFKNNHELFYSPEYLTYYFVLLSVIFLIILAYYTAKYRFNMLGKIMIFLSAFTFFMVFFYTLMTLYYLDEHPEFYGTLPVIGFIELMFLPYPFIFMILAMMHQKNK